MKKILPLVILFLAVQTLKAQDWIGYTLTKTLCVLLHPVATTVSDTEYVVVMTGLTSGLADVEVYPSGNEVHAYELPGTGSAPRVVVSPAQISLSAPAIAPGVE